MGKLTLHYHLAELWEAYTGTYPVASVIIRMNFQCSPIQPPLEPNERLAYPSDIA